MGFNFPNAPTSGQSFSPVGGPTFTWDGVAWKSNLAGMPVVIYASATPPPSPVFGQLWYNSDTGNTYLWFVDGDSSQWVQQNIQPAPIPGGTPVGTIRRTVYEGPAPTITNTTVVYTKPAGLKYLDVELWGGGGSANASGTASAGNAVATGGGGGGSYCRKLYAAADLAATENVVIGAGGNTPSGVGSNGRQSTFKGMVAGGGWAGAAASAAPTGYGIKGNGGDATGGDINIHGEAADGGWWAVTTIGMYLGGKGGSGGGPASGTGAIAPNNPPANSNRNGTDGLAPGGGGSGCSVNGTGTGSTGGLGGAGMAILTEYF